MKGLRRRKNYTGPAVVSKSEVGTGEPLVKAGDSAGSRQPVACRNTQAPQVLFPGDETPRD